MKLRSMFFMIFIISHSLLTKEQPQFLPPAISLTFNTQSQSNLTQDNALKQQTSQTKDMQNSDHIAGLAKQLQEFYEQQRQYYQQSEYSWIDWLQNHKLITIGISISMLYGYIGWQRYQTHLIIKNPASWSCWRQDQSIEDLCTVSQKQLQADLLCTMQNRYVHPINQTDCIYSLTESSISLNKEIETIQQQITLYTWLDRCKCLHLFFMSLQDLEILQEKYRKLCFMKHIFASWCAQYKIDKNL